MEKERTSSLCILSKSMLINFGLESIFVKVLRRYDTDYSKQHIGLFEGHINTKKTKYIGRAILMNDILRIALQRAFLGRAILRVILFTAISRTVCLVTPAAPVTPFTLVNHAPLLLK